MSVLVVIALVVFTAAAYFSRTSGSLTLSPPVPSPAPQLVPTSTIPVSPTLKPAITLSPTSTPIFFTTPQIPMYPNLTVISPGVYHSADDPQVITTWYQSQLKSRDYSVTSFVKTNTNNHILNTLVGSDNQNNISVEISKSPGSAFTQIVIKY